MSNATNDEQLTRRQRDRKRAVVDTKNKIRKLNRALGTLISECNHMVAKRPKCEGAYCLVCGENFGWWCPKSPKHYCEYSDDDIPNDHCIYCGEPEERK